MKAGRLRRYARRALWGVAVVTVLVGLAVTGFLGSLDTPYFRARVRALVKLPIDWQHTELSLTRGIVLRGFSIATPPPFDAIAPELLAVDEIEVSWALGKLLGQGPLAERIVISGVHAAIVIDAEGHSSLAALGGRPSDEAADGPALPRSHLLEVLGDRLPIEEVSVKQARVRLIHVDGSGRHQAEVDVDADVALPKPNELDLRVLVRLVAQDLIEELPAVHEVLQLSASASFRPAESRLTVVVHGLRGLDGALVGDAKVELPDEAPARLDEAKLALDTAPIQAALNHAKSPLRLHGEVKLHAHDVRVGAIPAVDPDGQLDVDAKIEAIGLRVGKLHIEGERLALDVELRGSESDATQHAHKATPAANPALGYARVDVKAHRFLYEHGGLSIELAGLALDTKVDGLDAHAAAPLQTLRGLRSTGQVDRFEVRPGSLDVIGEGTRLDAAVTLPGAQPGTLALDMPITRLAVSLGEHQVIGAIAADHSMHGDPAHIHAGLSQVRFDPAKPLAVRLAERGDVTLGPFTIHSQLDKTTDDAVGFDLDVAATSLQPLASFVALPPGDSVAWSEIGAHLHTKGRLDGLPRVAAFELEHETTLELVHPRLRGPYALAAARVAFSLRSHGGVAKHAGELGVTTEQLVVGEQALGAPALHATFALDRGRPSGNLDLSLSGGQAPQLAVRADGSLDRRTRTLTYAFHLAAAKLGPATRFLPAALVARSKLDFSTLALELDGKGKLRDVVVDMIGLSPRLAPQLVDRARGDTSLQLTARGVDYEDVEGSRSATLGTLELGLDAEADDGHAGEVRRHGKLTMALDHGDIYLGEHAVELTDFHPSLALDMRGPLDASEVDAELALTLGKLVQDYYAPYPVGGLSIEGKVRSDPHGLVRVDRLALTNRAAGTKLSLKGGLDLAARRVGDVDPLGGHLGIDLELGLEQALGAFSLGDGILVGGTIKLPVHVQSADLALFSIRGALAMEHVHLALAGPAIEATGVEGRVPISLAFVVEQRRHADGTSTSHLHLVPRADEISFPQPRFAEHQPFLAQRSFFSMEHLKLRTLEMGPIAGNLSIDDTRLELSQLEMRAAGGRVRGQLLAELAGEETKLAFRGSVTGLMPPGGHGKDDRLDANMSIVTQPLRLSLEGRAELVHISRRLLLDLLDVWDPYHAESSANRARKALDLGYPESVRLSFAHGFASLRLALGGLTSAVRIDEIKGVAVGALLERYVGQSLRGLLTDDADEADTTTPSEPKP